MSQQSNHYPEEQAAANGAWDCPLEPTPPEQLDAEYEAWLDSLPAAEPCGSWFDPDIPEEPDPETEEPRPAA
jgi:hypothetical protein